MGSGDGLFHMDPDGQMVSMTVTPYEAEEILQELLASHPDLLAGGQMAPQEPRRWVLVRREHGVPDREEATGSRWSLDHLFVDQDAVPTLVEVKRSSDTRIRREVVGQMFDYAANGVRYWPAESLQLAFEQTQDELGRDPLQEIARLCGDDTVTVAGFFEQVTDNLRAGRIRMVFVADVIPDELRRIVEFVNEQMDPAEVFAVQVKQYLAEGYPGKVFVPAVFGRTATASHKNAPRRVDPATIRANATPETRTLIELVDHLAAENQIAQRQTPSGIQLRRADGSTAAQLYIQYSSIDISLDPLRSRGLTELADSSLQVLQTMTTAKRLTPKYPSLPAADAVAHWEILGPLLVRLTAAGPSGTGAQPEPGP